MVEETIFSRIIRQEIPANIIYQDDKVTAFYDIAPRAPIHILIIPNKVIPTINDVKEEDETTLGHMITVAAKLAKREKIDGSGYRLVINCNKDGGQEVFHVHLHLLGGKMMGKMVND